jgi:hypothetical protein
MLGIVFELVRRGHAVRFTAPAVFAERITETGTRFCTGLPRETLGCNTIPQMHGAELARALQQSAHVMSRRSAVPAASTGATACMWPLSPTGPTRSGDTSRSAMQIARTVAPPPVFVMRTPASTAPISGRSG